MERVALYCRVSTEEQSRHGLSLDEQEHTLREYAKSHQMQIVDCYIDAGISARKKYTSRPELMRLLKDVQADRIDTIIFIKLDRWFRNVGNYYEVQSILDAHNVTWRATQEDYETATSSGRLKVNIMLSVAQDEADRTSERIKFVFDGKRARNEPINGQMPKGYKKEGKHVIVDPDLAPQIRQLFEKYWETGSPSAVIDAFPDLQLTYYTLRRILMNPAYKGDFEGIKIPPLISDEEYDKTQKMRRTPVRRSTKKRIYLFTGLLICPDCGCRLVGYYEAGKSFAYYYYLCPNHRFRKCTNKKFYREDDIEAYLLSHIDSKIEATITARKNSTPKSYKAQRDAVNRKISKLQDLYINEMINLDDYKKRYADLSSQLEEIPADEQVINEDSLKTTFNAGWKDIYNDLPREGKRLFWRNTLSSVIMSAESVADFYFAKNTI